MTYIEQDNPSVLCPLLTSHPRHVEWVRVQNGVYRATPRDADGEIIQDEQYRRNLNAAAHEMDIHSNTPDYMSLYHGTATARRGGAGSSKLSPRAYVDAWWFRCPVCHFVLPATAVQR